MVTYQASSNFICREIAGEYMLVPINSDVLENNLLMLNETGYFLWNQLQEPKSLDELIQLAELNFDSTDGSISENILTFINGLVRVGLVIERS